METGGHLPAPVAAAEGMSGPHGALPDATPRRHLPDGGKARQQTGPCALWRGDAVHVAAPAGYQFDELYLDRLAAAGVTVTQTDRPAEAVYGADVVYTDVWTSMGQEAESAERLKAFEGFGVDDTLMAAAPDDSIFLHCLPAHRGEEVAASVIDGDRSRVWPQAANRLTAVRAVLAWLHR